MVSYSAFHWKTWEIGAILGIPIKTLLYAQGTLEVLSNLLATALFNKWAFLWRSCQHYVWLE